MSYYLTICASQEDWDSPLLEVIEADSEDAAWDEIYQRKFDEDLEAGPSRDDREEDLANQGYILTIILLETLNLQYIKPLKPKSNE